MLKNWCFQIVVLEKTLEHPSDSKNMKPVNSKGNQPRTFIGRADTKTEAPILWPPDAKHRLSGKDPDAGNDWRQKEKRVTKDEMVGWHHQLNGHEFKQTLGGSEGRGNLVSCNSWGHKESDTTEWWNNNGAMQGSCFFVCTMLWQNIFCWISLVRSRYHATYFRVLFQLTI